MYGFAAKWLNSVRTRVRAGSHYVSTRKNLDNLLTFSRSHNAFLDVDADLAVTCYSRERDNHRCVCGDVHSYSHVCRYLRMASHTNKKKTLRKRSDSEQLIRKLLREHVGL